MNDYGDSPYEELLFIYAVLLCWAFATWFGWQLPLILMGVKP